MAQAICKTSTDFASDISSSDEPRRFCVRRATLCSSLGAVPPPGAPRSLAHRCFRCDRFARSVFLVLHPGSVSAFSSTRPPHTPEPRRPCAHLRVAGFCPDPRYRLCPPPILPCRHVSSPQDWWTAVLDGLRLAGGRSERCTARCVEEVKGCLPSSRWRRAEGLSGAARSDSGGYRVKGERESGRRAHPCLRLTASMSV